MITYLIIYWIFAGFFSFGYCLQQAQEDNKNLYVIFIATIFIGGLFFPAIMGNWFYSNKK